YKNTFAYPRAFVVHAITPVQDVDQAIRAMAQSAFNPATQAVVEGEIPTHWNQSLTLNQALLPPSEAYISERTSNTLHITTTLDTPGLLVVSESYAPGWLAYVDGQRAAIMPTDGFLRGVYLDADTHEVQFVYAPRSFTIGAAISLTTLSTIIISGILILIAKQRKQK
ncbi:MAG: YfhO family protein, partial [Roseiflexaceae bacterium]